MASAPLDPDRIAAPLASFTTSVPTLSEFTTAGPDTPLFLKLPETAYHRHSPMPSRRGGSPSVRHGNRPMAVVPSAPHGASAEPSLSLSGHGSTPGWLAFAAAYPMRADRASARAADV